MAICKLCNHDNPAGCQFCRNCGNALDIETAPKPEILEPVQAEVVSETSASPAPSSGAEATGAAAAGTSATAGMPGQPSGTTVTQPQPYVATQGPNSQYYEPANTVPFNSKDQQAYAQRMANPNKPDYENVCVLAVVFGILGFFFNPLYLSSLAAIVLGIIGHANQGSKKSLGLAGWILGLCALCLQLFFDLFCAAATCGWGSIVFCF